MSGRDTNPFFSNTCRFGDCGVAFPTLRELIEHIEETHIGLDTEAYFKEITEKEGKYTLALTWSNNDAEEEINMGWNQQNVPMNQCYRKSIFGGWRGQPPPHTPLKPEMFF
uniref:C2H2-type domain-containing protein n=1 Tax=Eptatretus burgeri TaxID=7764 RepID=A0A8C4R1S3_EPTBU